MGVHPTLMLERDEYIVFDRDARAKPAQLRIETRDGPEQQPRLIDQMRAEVVENAARIFGRSAFTPHDRWRAGSPAIEARFEPMHIAELHRCR